MPDNYTDSLSNRVFFFVKIEDIGWSSPLEKWQHLSFFLYYSDFKLFIIILIGKVTVSLKLQWWRKNTGGNCLKINDHIQCSNKLFSFWVIFFGLGFISNLFKWIKASHPSVLSFSLACTYTCMYIFEIGSPVSKLLLNMIGGNILKVIRIFQDSKRQPSCYFCHCCMWNTEC